MKAPLKKATDRSEEENAINSLSDVRLLCQLFRKTQVRPFFLFLAAILSLVTALFEGLSIGLLVPFARGVLERNFNFVEKLSPLAHFLDNLVAVTGRPYATPFVFFLALIFISAFLKNCFEYLSFLVLDKQVYRFLDQLRQRVFSRCLSFGKSFFDEYSAGHLTNLVMNFPMQIARSLATANQYIAISFRFTAYVILMLAISWPVTLVCLLILPFLHYIVNWLVDRTRVASSQTSDYENEEGRKLSNVLMGISLVKASSCEEEEIGQFSKISKRVAASQFSISKKQYLIPAIQEIITIFSFLLLIAVMSFLIVRGGVPNVGGFFVFFLVLRRAMMCVSSINRLRASLAVVSGPLREVWEIFDDTNKPFVAEGALVFSGLRNHIEFKNLFFSYREDLKTLDHLTLTIPKGKVTALVGNTGAGKTTLINLLLRFYDCEPGMILVDGEDIRNFTVKSLRHHIAYVGQDAVLFNDTIQMNMAYGLSREISHEDLVDAAQKARLYDFILSLPDGFNTVVGDRGVQLSGGEKQRLAIARAILKKAEIVILDEATSALDAKTEQLVQEAIHEAITGRTAIVIAHRLFTIQHADKIVVIESGRVVEEGSLGNLLSQKGEFYEFWQRQK